MSSLVSNAQYNALYTFTSDSGRNPRGSLIVSGSRFYGMTYNGGKYSHGVIFSIDTNGSNYKVLYDFNDSLGGEPYGSLIISRNKLYGMTWGGGKYGYSFGGWGDGVIFSVDTNGKNYKVLLNFNDTNGSSPYGSLTLVGHRLWGVTYDGGANQFGCIFSIDTSGKAYKDIYDFNTSSGINPYSSLLLSGNLLYGTLSADDSNDYGRIFSIDTNSSSYKELCDFDSTAHNPWGSVIIVGNKLYGTTKEGVNYGTIFSVLKDGSQFKTLHVFQNDTNGALPQGSLTFVDGVLYGMTSAGGLYSSGTMFSIDTNGSTFTKLVDFGGGGVNAKDPWYGSLILSGNGFYGMTNIDPQFNGVIFDYKISLPNAIEEVDALDQKGIDVFPNPASTHIEYIVNSKDAESVKMNVYDVLGKNVATKNLKLIQGQNTFTLNLSGYSKGVYLLQLVTEDGTNSMQRKFVVE
jgi:uncharacterized repeat protein (TIGR03803 family)